MKTREKFIAINNISLMEINGGVILGPIVNPAIVLLKKFRYLFF